MKRILLSVCALSLFALTLLAGCNSQPTAKAEEPQQKLPAGVYFMDDFEHGTTVNWDLRNPPGASWAVVMEKGNRSLQYFAGSTSNNIIAFISDKAWADAEKAAGGTLKDFSIEARIMPQGNSTTGNKQLYFILRYQDDNNWYLGGLNVQNSLSSTKVELGKRLAGNIVRANQVNKPISLGTWYTVRIDVIGNELTSYLDGVKIGSLTVSDGFDSGKIGIWTANRSFMLDDVVIKDPTLKPAAISFEPEQENWTAIVGDAPLSLNIVATKPDSSADSFTVKVEPPEVVSAKVEGDTVTLTALAQGAATISFTSGEGKSVSLKATIGPAFETGSSVYSMSKNLLPAAGEKAAWLDGKLSISFDQDISLLDSGMIRIYKTSDDSLVDEIKAGNEVNRLGLGSSNQVRALNGSLIKTDGKTLIITPHDGALQPETEYYVLISNATVKTGATFNGKAFDGMSKAAGWKFRTKAAPTGSSVRVSASGAADYRTVQGALNHMMRNKVSGGRISIADGIYEEALFLRDVNNLSVTGQSRDKTIIRFANYDTLNTGTGASAPAAVANGGGGRGIFLVESSDLLSLENLTIESSHVKNNDVSNQAEVLIYNDPAGRFIAKNCNFISYQDTLQTKGWLWFYNCLVAGDVDFIWGSAQVNLFENCEIRTRVDPRPGSTRSGGYLVQARGIENYAGYVFLNCKLTREEGILDNVTSLARSGAATYQDNVAYINCAMDGHIRTEGWFMNPRPANASLSRGWKEYGSTDLAGKALDLSARAAGVSIVLTDAQAKAFYADRKTIFGGASFGGATLNGYKGGWDPR